MWLTGPPFRSSKHYAQVTLLVRQTDLNTTAHKPASHEYSKIALLLQPLYIAYCVELITPGSDGLLRSICYLSLSARCSMV